MHVSKAKYEEFLVNSPRTKQMRNSLIYKTENSDFIKKESRFSMMNVDFLKEGKKKVSKKLPTPRDGVFWGVSENKLFVFGGDRNKFPYNDLHSFELQN